MNRDERLAGIKREIKNQRNTNVYTEWLIQELEREISLRKEMSRKFQQYHDAFLAERQRSKKLRDALSATVGSGCHPKTDANSEIVLAEYDKDSV